MATDANTAASNWAAGMNATGQAKYKQKVGAYQGNPMAMAAAPAAQQKYLSSVTDAVQSGRMAAKLNAVDPNFWKSQTTGAGATNWLNSATKGKPKYVAFAQKWAPTWAQAQQAAAAIPHDGTLASAAARVMAVMQVMRAAAGKPTA